FFQSHWSSSATIIGFTVSVPVPSSVCPTRMVTVSSGAMVIQALISGTAASRYQGWAATGTLAASALGGSQKPRTIAPPTAAVVARKSRRSMSVVFSGAVFPSARSAFFSFIIPSFTCCALPALYFLMLRPSGLALRALRSSFYLLRPAGLAFAALIRLTSQLGGAVNGLADTMICSAPARISHLGIDVGIRGVWLFFKQRHRCQD